MENKWFGTPKYEIAMHALEVIAQEIENPTYAQIMEVFECMRDSVAELCVLTVQK